MHDLQKFGKYSNMVVIMISFAIFVRRTTTSAPCVRSFSITAGSNFNIEEMIISIHFKIIL